MGHKKRSVELIVILLCMAAIACWYITSGIAEETNTNTNTNTNTTTINQIPNEGMQVSPIVHLGGYGIAANPMANHQISENYRLLVSIDKKIDNINARLTRMEKALNLEPVRPTTMQKQILRYGTN